MTSKKRASEREKMADDLRATAERLEGFADRMEDDVDALSLALKMLLDTSDDAILDAFASEPERWHKAVERLVPFGGIWILSVVASRGFTDDAFETFKDEIKDGYGESADDYVGYVQNTIRALTVLLARMTKLRSDQPRPAERRE